MSQDEFMISREMLYKYNNDADDAYRVLPWNRAPRVELQDHLEPKGKVLYRGATPK